MLSINQKDTIYRTILKSYIVDETGFELNCIYNNQIISGRVKDPVLEHMDDDTGYPIIVISYIPGEKIIGDIENRVSWKYIILSTDIYTKNYDNRPSDHIINGQILVDELSRQFINDVNDNWNDDFDMSEENIKLYTPVLDPIDLSNMTGTPHVYRNHIDVHLIYKEE